MPFGPEVLIVLGVIVLLFGGSKLPGLARSLGSAKQEFEAASKGQGGPAPADATRTDTAAVAAPVVATPAAGTVTVVTEAEPTRSDAA
jgi:sec-independent protein translocase protein TatA